MYDQTPARAVVEFSDVTNWPPTSAPPQYSIRTAFREGSWAEFQGRNAKGTRRLFRNPAGDLWYQPARYGSIREWQPAKATGWFLFDWLRQLKQWDFDMAANRTPLVIPWDPSWREAGGTQAQAADNGCIVILADGTSYEIQGMAPLSDLDIAGINARCLQPVARRGDYRCDGITHRRPGVTPHGSQGPVWKGDGLLRPEHLERFVPGLELSYVLPNTEWGPKARAVAPGWVEHRNSQPFAGRMGGAIIPDVGPGKVPNFCGLALDITDAEIERWINWCETDPDGISPSGRRHLAQNWRGYETDADRPTTLGTRIRVRESGTGQAILESVGDSDPTTAAAWAIHGVTAKNAGGIGRGIYRFGRLVVTAGFPA